jgi:methyl-accepting chemotaxis protein
VGEISAASNEQAQGIEQINKAVSEMDKVVQKNAASAEESASASEEMNAQAEMMKGYVADLVALVNGNSNGVVSVKGAQPVGIGNGQTAALRPKQKTGVKKALAAFTKKEKRMDAAVHHQAKEVRPEQVIPMEEGDFKQF